MHLNFPLHAWRRCSLKTRVLLLAVPLLATASFFALGVDAAPSIPPVVLSADPLYAPSAVDKPALALALSVEYPTVGAQYVDPDHQGTSDDETYSPSNEYLGYYDAESCYTYDDTGAGAAAGQAENYKRFVRRGPALPLATPLASDPTRSSRMCWDNSKSYSKDDGTSPAFSNVSNDGFSGNFLNWASNSAIDMLRLALTGGDRVIDTATLTVLQRAMIPNGDPIAMGNSSNFPSKKLRFSGQSKAITSSGFASASFNSGVAYFGALPTSMATAANLQDVVVANTLNRIYFGTSKSGHTTSDFGGYTLGGAAPVGGEGTVTNPYLTPGTAYGVFSAGSGFTACPANGNSSEGLACPFSGIKEVLYGTAPVNGAGGGWLTYIAANGVTCGNNMSGSFNDPVGGVVKRCYYRDYTPPASTSANALNSNGFFYARVQVCDRDASTYALKDKRYWNLCTRYSDGAATPHPSYKPTGVVQAYSDQLRLAAFGYVMDPNTSRVGGVLRAPMKYVGAKTFDTNGVDITPASGNPKREWDPLTGVFNLNPESTTTLPADGRTTALSGVVNYLNQFGRTGAVPGRYKTYDPIGELHYEAVRYLQGLQPTPAAISGLNADMYDGYPVYTTWNDPYGDGRSSSADYSCVKSNVVVIGDKNTWDYNNRLPAANAANNIPDILGWQGVAAKFENRTAGNYLDGAGTTRAISNPNTANGAGLGSASGDVSIVGSAYWAHTHDIRGTGWTNATASGIAGTTLQRPGLRVKTFMFDVNEYGGSNDADNRRTSNALFRAAKYGGFEADPSNTAKNPYNTYGNPFVDEKTASNNNYVWADTDTRVSRVGEANTYFLQSDARGVLSAFDDIFKRAATAARSIAGGAIQSKNLTQVGDTIYQGTFDTSDWSGDLVSIPVSVSNTNVVSVGATFNWTAATQLATLSAPATSRTIVVGKAGATSSPVASAFLWTDIETSLQDALNKSSPGASADGLGQDRLNYLRGDRSKEGSVFRTRSKLMGDVINSGVVYSGKPSNAINDVDYPAFYNAHAARTPAVFVGANDGMLHAFDAAVGTELFAYIPSWLGSKLSALTSASYVSSHQSYVDGTATVGEALVGSNWKTVLVSGTGGGGKGVFALDVSDPASFTATNAMWEFTKADDADLGNVVGRPQILKLRTSDAGATTVTYKWFAVFGSGVNNYVPDGGIYSSTGKPALFLLDLNKAAGSAWALGTNYYKISLPVDATLGATRATGLLNFRPVLGNSREVTQIFMGDLHGNLWKLDFTTAGSSAWNMGSLSYFKQGTTNAPIPMFIAKDGSGKAQPISAAPTLAFGNTLGSFAVMFGTGKYIETADRSNTDVQSAYMVYDTGNNSLDSTPANTATSAISSRLRLKQASSVNSSTGVVSFAPFMVGRATTDLNTDNPRSGWVFDMPAGGERQVSNGTLFGSSVIFASLIPGAGSAAACAVSGGGGNQFTIDVLGGGGSFIASQVGILGEPMVAEISSATAYSAADSTGRRIKTVTNQVFQQGSNGIAAGTTVTRQLAVGRMSWRQINNYQDLKNAP